VIGGGVTGAGIARDLALRGVSVLLLEKGDWGGGTSGASSWMIHGGPRYLEFDWDTTRLSTTDAGHIVTIARNIVYRVAFIIPVLPHDKNNIERMETAMEVYDRFQPLKKSHPHVRLTPEEARQVEPGLTEDLIGAVTMEEWGVDPHRLVFANVQDAVAHGARAMNHTRVVELLRDGGAVIGVRYQTSDGATSEARAKVVVNAAGPWVPEVGAMAGTHVQLRPAKGIHIVYPHRISNFSISAESIDGRDLLMVSHAGFTLLGTTDDDFYGDLDSIDVAADEVEYLLQAFERVFPSIRQFRPVRTTTGVRPTLFKWRRYEDELSRRYQIFDHTADGVDGFVTIAGGKLSMYRLMAEETSDAVCRKLGHQTACQTAARPLPGSETDMEPAAELARRCGVSALAAVKLQSRHGASAADVLGDARASRLVCRCEPLTEAELAYAARHEQVHSLADGFRRVGLAAGPCAGAACVLRAAEIIGRELGWSASQRFDAAREFIHGAWLGRAPVLQHAGWAEEELVRGAWRGLLN
jgi:glycerol-3-phosphate dehydrogenase